MNDLSSSDKHIYHIYALKSLDQAKCKFTISLSRLRIYDYDFSSFPKNSFQNLVVSNLPILVLAFIKFTKVLKFSVYLIFNQFLVHKHDFNNLCYPLFQPLRWVSSLSLILSHLLLTISWFIIILMFKMYNVHCFYLQFSFVYSGPTD